MAGAFLVLDVWMIVNHEHLPQHLRSQGPLQVAELLGRPLDPLTVVLPALLIRRLSKPRARKDTSNVSGNQRSRHQPAGSVV